MHTRERWCCSDRSALAAQHWLCYQLHQASTPQRAASKGKAFKVFCTLELPPHPYWDHARFCPPPMAGSCKDIWDDNHFSANHTLTQTTTASAFQLAQSSRRSWESLKARCVFGKAQLCRHSSIKSSAEQRSLLKAELFAFCLFIAKPLIANHTFVCWKTRAPK